MKPLSHNEYSQIAAAVERVRDLPPPSQVDLPPPEHLAVDTVSFLRFELKEDLTANDTTAAAYVLRRDPESQNQELKFWDGPSRKLIDTSKAVAECGLETINIWSFNGWTGSGRDESDTENIVQGSRGLAIHLFDVDKWEVVGGRGQFKLAKLDEQLDADDSAPASIWAGDPLADTGENEEAYDYFLPTGKHLDSGTRVLLQLISGKWYVIKAWVEKTFITDIQLGTGYIQKKTATIVCCWADDDSSWTNAIQTTSCS